ncbi:3-oxoacyl-[acyl-carrier-protein] synthase 3 [Firmicutes bacterium CAG:227]|nr:3-oxoacyl-[acyl-carrier-protein] synthase 3 [Firmicutes bacterium CAG:227]
MTARIIGTGSAVPEQIVTNEDLSKIVETSDEWISSRSGIKERRVAKEENTTSLAILAGKRALENAGVTAEEIEVIIVATCTPDYFFPNTACQVQEAIGAKHAVAFDLSAACSGFLFALSTAQAYIKGGIYQKALIIGAETMSKMIDWSDRSTCVLFGDGAGAAVVSAEETGVLELVQKSNGAGKGVLSCKARETRNLLNHESETKEYLYMEGQPVFKFAVKTVPECVEEVLKKAEVRKEEIRYYILHQANSRIIQSVAKRLKEPEEKFPMNLSLYGNTSAASIPILLDEMNRNGMLNRGDKLVLSGFGAGLTWGAVLLEW